MSARYSDRCWVPVDERSESWREVLRIPQIAVANIYIMQNTTQTTRFKFVNLAKYGQGANASVYIKATLFY